MPNHQCVWIAVVAMATFGTVQAEPQRDQPSPADRHSAPRSAMPTAPGHAISVGVPGSGRGSVIPPPTLMRAIAAWLTINLRLPSIDAMPEVRFVSPAAIAAFRHTGVLSDDPQHLSAIPAGQREVVATYDELNRTIYLPLGWRGNTPAETSMLVHEMVHHIQAVAQVLHPCPEAREEAAYAAQEKWLQLFGRSLAADFDIDPFTLLVSTQCSF